MARSGAENVELCGIALRLEQRWMAKVSQVAWKPGRSCSEILQERMVTL
jgi:hypothetical protein